MALVLRDCPVCGASEYEEISILRQKDFTTSNPSYQLEKLGELDIDPDQQYPIVKCNKCTMIYSLYHLCDDAEAFVYQRIIDPKASLEKVLTISKRIKDTKSWLRLLTLAKGSVLERINLKVMDYGCGWGTLLLAAQGPGVKVVGFDVTEWKIAWAREQGLTICTTAQELDAYAPFDIVISTSVLEHLRTPRDALKTITSLLKPNGYTLITCVISPVEHESGWNEIKERLQQGRPLPKEINPWEHLNYFTVDTLRSLLAEYNLTPILSQVQPDDPQVFFQNLKKSWKSGRPGFRTIVRYLKNHQKGASQMWPKIPQYWQYRKTQC